MTPATERGHLLRGRRPGSNRPHPLLIPDPEGVATPGPEHVLRRGYGRVECARRAVTARDRRGVDSDMAQARPKEQVREDGGATVKATTIGYGAALAHGRRATGLDARWGMQAHRPRPDPPPVHLPRIQGEARDSESERSRFTLPSPSEPDTKTLGGVPQPLLSRTRLGAMESTTARADDAPLLRLVTDEIGIENSETILVIGK